MVGREDWLSGSYQCKKRERLNIRRNYFKEISHENKRILIKKKKWKPW